MKRNYLVVYRISNRTYTKKIEAKNSAEAAFIAGHSFPLQQDVDFVSVELVK